MFYFRFFRLGFVCLSSSSRSNLSLDAVSVRNRLVTISRVRNITATGVIGRRSMSFNVSQYDCVGFDLDHTLCRYKVDQLFPLIYDTLCKYLVEKKGYDEDLLLEPFDNGSDFMHKGLMLDIKRGNILKVGKSGVILRATHGTHFMSHAQVVSVYGSNRLWEPLVTFKDILNEGMNEKISKEIRTFKDYFDMPFALVCARIVDLLDRKNELGVRAAAGVGNGIHKSRTSGYEFWPDVLDGAIDMYRIEGFANHTGGFFPALKEDLERYVVPCSDTLKQWLRKLKRDKSALFLLTGSNVDFATMLAEYCLGTDWRSYFDIVVTFARKPGFFTGRRKFFSCSATAELQTVVADNNLERGQTYSQGNYARLLGFLSQLTGESDPKVLYVGDNLMQDVLTPSKFSRCHTVAILEEMEAEGMRGLPDQKHVSPEFLTSSRWGSFFYDEDVMAGTGDSTVFGVGRVNTLWADVVLTHSQIAVPSLECLALLPTDTNVSTFSLKDRTVSSGFHPAEPNILHN